MKGRYAVSTESKREFRTGWFPGYEVRKGSDSKEKIELKPTAEPSIGLNLATASRHGKYLASFVPIWLTSKNLKKCLQSVSIPRPCVGYS